VKKLIVYQVDPNDEQGLFNTPLVLLDFWIGIVKWTLFHIIHNLSKVYQSQYHLYFELSKIEVLSIKLINNFNILTFK